ncbi:MAG: iron ABC transporter permease [Proteobacteria bacterium]|nr:iron ABC transporter permease [Pseudomonadota bacterium]MBU1738581.1 iron ABC transporter permease [Pseudomonadota bacterium]
MVWKPLPESFIRKYLESWLQSDFISINRKLLLVLLALGILLLLSICLGVALGSSEISFREMFRVFSGEADPESVTTAIIRQIRLPRVVLAAVIGATLALGGLVFQVLLRNPLAEPYILGVSGGSAIGAILAMLAGLAPFPGVALAAFSGSMLVLLLVLMLATGRSKGRNDSLLLGGVMMNALCGAVIMFLISMSRNTQVHHILFWLMGDLSTFSREQLPLLLPVFPCFIVILIMARPMNLLLLGQDNAAVLGVNVKLVTNLLLIATTFMVSVAVSHSGLIGFAGLVVPHILRLLIGGDHRLLIPASILGGGSYLIICDLLARSLPASGEMPVGIVTALIGAPTFIFLLWRANR